MSRPSLDTLVARMSTSPRERQAYKVKCPLCSAAPAQFCTYMPGPLGPYQQPNPKWGKPTKRPHSERHQVAYESEARKQRKALRQKWMELHADPVAPARQALGQLARQEYAQMRSWLAINRRLFLEL